MYIDKPLIKGGVYQTALANPILRAGRGEVTEDRMFEMRRPAWEQPSGLPWSARLGLSHAQSH